MIFKNPFFIMAVISLIAWGIHTALEQRSGFGSTIGLILDKKECLGHSLLFCLYKTIPTRLSMRYFLYFYLILIILLHYLLCS